MVNQFNSDYLSKKFNSFYMTETLIKSRYSPRYKIKSQKQPSNLNLPPNLQSFKEKLISGNGFIVYR